MKHRPAVSSAFGYARNPSEAMYPGLWRKLVRVIHPSVAFSPSYIPDPTNVSRGLTGNTTVGRCGSPWGTAMDFTAGTGLYTAGNARTSKDWSFFCRLWMPTGNPSCYIFTNYKDNFNQFLLFSAAGRLYVDVYKTSDWYIAKEYPVQTWMSVAANIDYTSGSLKMYFNGEYVTPSLTGGSKSDPTLGTDYLGAYGADGSTTFTGKMHELVQYNRLLSPSEIALLHSGYSPLTPAYSVVGKSALVANRRRRVGTGFRR